MTEIKNAQALRAAAENEFWSMFPDMYAKWCKFFGNVIHAVQNDGINEYNYIHQWFDKLPEEKQS